MFNSNRICNNILDAVGSTPLIKLDRVTKNLSRNVFVKFEGLNPGGSIKTRAALNMIKDAEEKGLLSSDSTIVEYTSGNQGIGLALVAAVRGYKCTIVMPACMSEERRQILRAYGAEVISTDASGSITEAFERAKTTAEQLASDNESYFLAGQFNNPANCYAHYAGTANEIIMQMDDIPLDAFVAAIGTGGTITGCAHRLKQAYPSVKIVAVEPEKAAILSGGIVESHNQQGIGDGFIPEILDISCYDHVVTVSDEEAYATGKRLACEEGIFCGISSGTNVCAAIKYAETLPEGSNVVTICVDLGDRYLSIDGFI